MIGLMGIESQRHHANRARAESFGAVAFAYDRARPDYPAALVDELLAGGPRQVLDVGCGTGKVARLLRERGVDVLGVEIDERMAEIARSYGISVEIGRFESWDAGGRRFDLIVSGQAWHWVEPWRGARRAAALLRAPGRLVAFWNFAELDVVARAALAEVYRRVAPRLGDQSVLTGSGPATIPGHIRALQASGLFASVEHRRYPWARDYTRDQWLDMSATHSDHLAQPEDQRAAVLREVGAAIDALGGTLRAQYTTEAIFAVPG